MLTLPAPPANLEKTFECVLNTGRRSGYFHIVYTVGYTTPSTSIRTGFFPTQYTTMLIPECVLIFAVVISALLGTISEAASGDSKGKLCCKVDLTFFLKRSL